MLHVFLALALCADPPVPTAEDRIAVGEEKPLHRHPVLLAMLRRSNSIRRGVGLRPTRINPTLCKAAQDHANFMAATGTFSHYNNGGYQYRAQKYGFKGFVQENIAAGFGSVDATFNTWQASGGHYAAIVGNYSEAGFGYAVAPNGGTYWVGVYGSPAQGDEAGEEETPAPASEAIVAAVANAESSGTMTYQNSGRRFRFFRRR